MQKKPNIDDEDVFYGIGIYQKLVSPSKLVTFIKEKLPVKFLLPGGMSSTCHACGELLERDGMTVTCSCGKKMDCDANTCYNMLASEKVVE